MQDYLFIFPTKDPGQNISFKKYDDNLKMLAHFEQPLSNLSPNTESLFRYSPTLRLKAIMNKKNNW